MENLRAMPSNLQAELDLLGNLIKNNKKTIEVIGNVTVNDFYNNANAIIFETITEMYKNDIAIDLTTLASTLGVEKLKAIGGITYLSKVVGQTLTSNIKDYAKLIKSCSIRRKIIKASQEAIEKVYKDINPKEIITEFEGEFIEETNDKEKTYTVEEVMLSTITNIEENYKNGGKITGISTGYRSLDNGINGLVKGDLIVIAARPSIGKTALALNIMQNIEKSNKAAIFELEMSKEKIGSRMLSAKAAIDSKELPRGNIKENDFSKILTVANHYTSKNNLFFNCSGSLTIEDIKAECKRLKLKYGLDTIFIDHLGYLTSSKKTESRVKEVGIITKTLKALAKELDISVVLLSQLSRGVEQRQDKHPQLADLRDSGNIEEDADSVIMLYRDDYYAVREKRDSKNPGIMEAGIMKARDGDVGWAELKFIPEYQLITNNF